MLHLDQAYLKHILLLVPRFSQKRMLRLVIWNVMPFSLVDGTSVHLHNRMKWRQYSPPNMQHHLPKDDQNMQYTRKLLCALFTQNKRHHLYRPSTKASTFRYPLYSSQATTTAKWDTIDFIVICWCWVSHIGDNEKHCFLECDSMSSRDPVHFWWIYTTLHLLGQK
jgi:hypothetical protein